LHQPGSLGDEPLVKVADDWAVEGAIGIVDVIDAGGPFPCEGVPD
jgi:hypothetical protein